MYHKFRRFVVLHEIWALSIAFSTLRQKKSVSTEMERGRPRERGIEGERKRGREGDREKGREGESERRREGETERRREGEK